MKVQYRIDVFASFEEISFSLDQRSHEALLTQHNMQWAMDDGFPLRSQNDSSSFSG